MMLSGTPRRLSAAMIADGLMQSNAPFISRKTAMTKSSPQVGLFYGVNCGTKCVITRLVLSEGMLLVVQWLFLDAVLI
jgi:hypothetical protein